MHVEIPAASTRDRFLVLRSMPAFAALGDEDLHIMAELTRRRAYDAKTVITEEGQPHEYVYLLIEGRVRVSMGDRTLVVADAPGGFGFLATMSGRTETFRAVAETPTVTLELPEQALWQALRTNYRYLRNALRLNATALLEARSSLPVNPGDHYTPQMGVRPKREKTTVEHMLALRQSMLFADVNADAVIRIARHASSRTFSEGTRMWEIGDPSTHSFQIEYGLVQCESPEGKSVDIGAGFVLGSFDGVAGRVRSYSATAKTEVVGVRLEIEEFFGVIETHPELGIRLLMNMAQLRMKEQPA